MSGAVSVANTVGAARTTAGPRVVRVAIAGCGVVGSELIRLIRSQARELAAADAVRLEITSVLVRRPEIARDVPVSPDRFTSDAAHFAAAGADVVVEAIGGPTSRWRSRVGRSDPGAGW
jgi:homoserine dehydrogenase